MQLVELRVKEFADVMASDAPAPGGGSAAALAGALGAALTAMVGALTLGKKKYEDCQALAEEVQAGAVRLKDELTAAVDRDTEAFNVISAAFSMPKETEEEKTARSEAIQNGLAACIESPLTIMAMSHEALGLAERLLGGFNESAASDLGVSALMLRAGLLGAWLNVRINLGSLKDKEKAAVYEARAREILEKALPLADSIYRRIEEML